MSTDGGPRDLFVIGGSAGGIQATMRILSQLPADLPATVGIVLHRSPFYVESQLAEVLSRAGPLTVSEPANREPLQKGRVYLAPRDRHMTVDGQVWRVERGPKMHRARPAVDPLFESAARIYDRRAVGIVLSGTGSDGVKGCVAIKAAGGLTVVQKPDEAQYASMPLTAIHGDDVDFVLSAQDIAALVLLLTAGEDLGPLKQRRHP